MADLFPTKTRIELLWAVYDGEVTGYPSYDTHGDEYYQDGAGRGRKVTTRIEELLKVDWVHKGPKDSDAPLSTFRVRLTDAGRKVLEGNANG